MADEAPVLQQYSKQLNVYNGDLSDRGRLSVNASDAFEISYKTGLGSVLIRNLSYQTGDLPEGIHNIDTEMYNINVKCDTNRFNSDAAEGVFTSNNLSSMDDMFFLLSPGSNIAIIQFIVKSASSIAIIG